MKKNIFILAVTGFMVGTLFTACEPASKEEKLENAEQEVIRADENLRVAQEEFKRDAELRIEENERLIVSSKDRIKTSDEKMRSNLEKEIDRLEARNRELKAKIRDYNNERKEDWEAFKKEFNHDMDELGSALKNFTVNNEK